MQLSSVELLSLWTAFGGYALTCALVLLGFVGRRDFERLILLCLGASWLLHSIAILIRWWRLGHLPFINMFEMLSSNVWGYMAAILFAYILLPRLRAFAVIVLPIVLVLMTWMLLPPNEDSTLPATYHTLLFYIHIALLKVFVGAALVAVGLAGLILLRPYAFFSERLSHLPSERSLDESAYRCMMLAFIFHSCGVFAGAVWAQNAWGHYWSWDPLEIWALLTWLAIGLSLHLRSSFNTQAKLNSWMILLCYALAFFTFFGIPFVSKALHKGMI